MLAGLPHDLPFNSVAGFPMWGKSLPSNATFLEAKGRCPNEPKACRRFEAQRSKQAHHPRQISEVLRLFLLRKLGGGFSLLHTSSCCFTQATSPVSNLSNSRRFIIFLCSRLLEHQHLLRAQHFDRRKCQRLRTGQKKKR